MDCPRTAKLLRPWVALLPLCVAACGGGSNTGGSPPPSVPVRGTLVQNPPHLASLLPATQLLVQLGTAANTTLLSLGGTPVCDIGVYHIEYNTVGARNEAATASGALMVPTGSDARCRGPLPIVLYAHGTTTTQPFDIANLPDPQNAEGLLLAAVFAAQGYIVVAPNYTGYDTSSLGYHPYLVADAQSKDMIDALAAARQALPFAGALLTTDSGKLFITGYSQGGFVAMATQRAMQAAGQHVSASAPMSGPYALAAMVDAVMSGQVDSGAPILMTMLVTAYQRAYGNIYATPGEFFSPQYLTGIESLLPGVLARSELYAQGRLPQYALFSVTPPDPAYASITPATQPAALASIFAQGFGSGNLVTNSYRLAYLRDLAAHPDGGWPVATTNAPPVGAGIGLRQALAVNDLRSFTPNVPTQLCGGNGDPVVYWLNSQLIQAYWASRQPAATGITALDVDSAATAGDPWATLKSQFSVAKQAVAVAAVLQGATDLGRQAVFDAYHATLVAPFCLAATRSFFAAH
jgi:dienelactone hydrolase